MRYSWRSLFHGIFLFKVNDFMPLVAFSISEITYFAWGDDDDHDGHPQTFNGEILPPHGFASVRPCQTP